MGHGNEFNSEIAEQERVADLEAQITELRAELEQTASTAIESTRDRSPVKPADHLPAANDLVTIEFMGCTFTSTRGKFNSLRIIDLLERNLIVTALRALSDDEAVEAFLEKNPDADMEAAGKLLEKIAEATGAGN